MKKITALFALLMLVCMGAQAQNYSITENAANRQHITDPGNLADGDVIMLQATEQTQKYFGGPNHTTDGTDDSYWKLVASGTSFKLVKFISTATGATPVYLKAPTATGLDPIQTTDAEADAALLTFSTPATNYIRFTAKVNNSGADTYLNCNSSYSTVKWATGTGGWSYWKVFKTDATLIVVTQEQSEAYDKVQSWLPLIQNSHALVTDASNYVSNARQQDNEGLYTSLLDKNNGTYFHSAWGGTMASQPNHDLQARLPEAVNAFYLFYVTRSTGTGYPTGFRIDGSNNAADFTDAAAGGATWTNSVTTLSGTGMPTTGSASYLSDKITLSEGYQYLRFVPTIGNNKNENWFCLAEFWLFPSNAAIDAAITMMKSVNAAYEITAEMISQINQIDEDLRSTTVNVTYNLVVDGTTVESKVVTQAKNSAVSIPVDLTKGYSSMGYDFVPEGTIGTTDCVITVTATPKEGVVTDLANLSNEKAYMLTTARGSLGTDGTQMVSTFGTSYSASDFAIISYEGKYYLWSVADSKWVANKTKPTLTEDLSEVGALVLDPTSLDKPFYFIGMGTNGVNIASGYGTGVVVNTWTTRDDGNKYIIKENGNFDPTNAISALDEYFHPSYTITYVVKEGETELFRSEPVGTTLGATITTLPEEYQRSLFYTYNTVDVTISQTTTEIEFTATLKENAPFKFTADTSAPVWYNLAFTSTPNYVTYVADGAQNVQLPTTLTDDETTQWAFIGNPYAGFQLVNNAAGTDLVLGSDATKGSANTGKDVYATLQSKGSQKNEVWTAEASSFIANGFFLRNTEGDALNKRNGTANISYWVGGADAGSTFVASKVLSDEEKYNELIALLESYPFGTSTNQYSLTLEGADQTKNALTLLQNLKDAGYSEDNQAELDKIVAGMSLNMPKAGFYRIKGNTSGKYLAAGSASNGKYNMTDAVDATTIFCFDGTKLINYSNGMVNGMNASSWDWVYGDGAASEVTFEDGESKGGYRIKSSNAYFFDGGTSADRGGGYDSRAQYHNWYLEEVKELPVTLHESETKEGYSVWIATFSAPVSVVSVEGAEIHKVSDTGAAFFCEPANVQGIPAGKGALLVTDTETATATVTLGETSEDFETILQPLYACEKGKAGLFFGKVEGSQIAGLYPIDSERPTGGFKAFVDDSTGEGKELVFDQDPTGIENIEHGTLNMNNGAIYNLQGQKVNKAQKGVFIQNGKKVVLK